MRVKLLCAIFLTAVCRCVQVEVCSPKWGGCGGRCRASNCVSPPSQGGAPDPHHQATATPAGEVPVPTHLQTAIVVHHLCS